MSQREAGRQPLPHGHTYSRAETGNPGVSLPTLPAAAPQGTRVPGDLHLTAHRQVSGYREPHTVPRATPKGAPQGGVPECHWAREPKVTRLGGGTSSDLTQGRPMRAQTAGRRGSKEGPPRGVTPGLGAGPAAFPGSPPKSPLRDPNTLHPARLPPIPLAPGPPGSSEGWTPPKRPPSLSWSSAPIRRQSAPRGRRGRIAER